MPDKKPLLQRLVPWVVLIALICVALAYVFFIFVGGINEEFLALYKANFLGIIGLPLCALAALFVVFVLEQTQGPIEFKGLSFEFKGAAGPILLWIACFLALALTLHKVWNPNY